MTGCSFLYVDGTRVEIVENGYMIDPYSILAAQGTNDPSQFVLIEDYPYFEIEFNAYQTTWDSQDYFNVLNLFINQVWEEDLTDWKLHSVWYDLACDENDLSLKRGGYYLFSEQFENGRIVSRILRRVSILPDSGLIATTEEIYTANSSLFSLTPWSEVKVNEVISLEEAMFRGQNILGKSLGSEKLETCDIRVELFSNAEQVVWQIEYTAINGNREKFLIDANSLE
jgi:hypothetical protein